MAAVTHRSPATLSQPSRKGKKAWRKNVDLRDVEHGLDTVRDEIIHGGVIAEKPSDELFTLDTTGDAAAAEKHQRGKKLLKADEILAQRSAVPGLPGRKRKTEEPHLPSTDGKKSRNGTYVPYKELQRLRRVADNAEGGVQVDDAPSHDVWAQPTIPANAAHYDFLEPPKPRREPTTLKQAPAALTRTGRPVAHVRKPDAGKSYNPQVEDWSALLQREGAAAVVAEQKRIAEEVAAEEKEARLLAEAAKVEAAEKAADMTDGNESGWESEWDGIHSEAETAEAHHTRKPQPRKTQAERNKLKARKERIARETWERKQRTREEQERRIKQIARDVSAVDRERHAAALARQVPEFVSSDSDENDGEIQLQRTRFGLAHIPDAPLEVTLPEELQDSLRRLKPEGNLLTDRYRNLLINGKLEVRRRAPERKKRKTFRTEKWSYKDWELK